jgi:protocatechuate 3,4-dioxygenase beta subunit
MPTFPSKPSRLRSRLALAAALLLPLAARALTPELTEGPFYPFNSSQTLPALTERDSDLTHVGQSTTASPGTLFLLSGRVVDAAGKPVSGATVELWQTDDGGVYYHSGDNKIASLDKAFQHFGEAKTGADGAYVFRTVRPGLYTGRIRHFHFKVKLGGATVLTSQFIFEDQRAEFSRDGVTAGLSGESLEAIVLAPKSGTDAAGAAALLATKEIMIDPAARSSEGPGGRGPRGGRPPGRPPVRPTP